MKLVFKQDFSSPFYNDDDNNNKLCINIVNLINIYKYQIFLTYLLNLIEPNIARRHMCFQPCIQTHLSCYYQREFIVAFETMQLSFIYIYNLYIKKYPKNDSFLQAVLL